MIDYALGLQLDEKELSVVKNAYRQMADWEQSLNQTVNYMKDVPMFVDVEVKKRNAAVVPEVQLAIWAGALYNKRKLMKWDRSMPIPGIVVDGHHWDCYITFEQSPDKLVSTAIYVSHSILSALTSS